MMAQDAYGILKLDPKVYQEMSLFEYNAAILGHIKTLPKATGVDGNTVEKLQSMIEEYENG